MLTVEEIRRFHKRKSAIPKIVRRQVVKNKSIIYGGYALNTHLPKFLKRHTEDFDVYSKKPEKSASELEKKLDKRFKGDFFYIRPPLLFGVSETHRVMNRVTEKEIADFTRPENRVPFVRKGNVRVASLDYIEGKLQRILNDPMSSFRHAKDRDALRRISVIRQRGLR